MTEEQRNAETARDYEKVAMRVSMVSIVANLVLTVFKLLAGVIAHSGAMISDAIHSASDVFSTIVVIVGVRMSGRESDKDHPYGHERMECVASIVLATVLAVTGLGIGYSALTKITGGEYENLAVPGILALVAAVLSIVVKEGM
ncbi:MAG: cation diffusion facilitator family transporter, partial [Lachnospiraceae bacterium]|nr:cation diffusion facilitator family transporter [Lachnospiraceae bacterium]